MYDAIVIGARCAGAATAMLLARAGLHVLAVDRAELGSDLPRGHFIHQHGPRRLAEWGLLDRLLATGCPPVTSSVLDFGDVASLSAGELSVDGVPMGLGPRRTALDRVLAEAAIEAGAELRTGFAVQEVTVSGGRVTGIRGREPGGPEVRELAPLVIGADGCNSGLARRAGATLRESTPSLTCWYFSYWSDVPGDALEIYVRERRAIFAFPTNDGLFAVFVAWPAAELPGVRLDIPGSMREAIALVPELAERVAGGVRVERYSGATHLPNFIRRSYGPGWALVGDAGCHKDPFLALGVCDALRDAELLAGALVSGAGLAEYERRRDEATLPGYRDNLKAARLLPPEGRQAALLGALQGNAEATRRFMLAREGMIDPESFFAESSLREVFAAAR